MGTSLRRSHLQCVTGKDPWVTAVTRTGGGESAWIATRGCSTLGPRFAASTTITAVTIAFLFEIVVASTGSMIGHMTTLAHFRVGRILLHLLAMLGDRCVRFHAAGIMRELTWVEAAASLPSRMRARLMGALALYLTQPVKHSSPATIADTQSLAAILDRGDVLLSEGNTRAAALVKLITRSTCRPQQHGVEPSVHPGRPFAVQIPGDRYFPSIAWFAASSISAAIGSFMRNSFVGRSWRRSNVRRPAA
jgi:hypothetical protein